MGTFAADSEHAMEAVARKVREEVQNVKIVPEHSTEGDSKSNGDIEQCNDYMRGKIKTIVDRHVIDPVGPEFMAPPARS